MKSLVLLPCSLSLVLTGCGNKYVADSGDSSPPYVFIDSGETETGETGESGDSEETDVETEESGESADTHETAETGETGAPEVPLAVTLEVYPASITVGVGATWTERAIATLSDGTRGDAVGVTWAVEDTTIASVDADGLVTGVAVGTTLLHALLDGLDTAVTVNVTEENILTVTVYDRATGLVIPDAKVKTDMDTVRTDATGVALAPVADGSPATVTAYVDDNYSMVTYVGATTRNVIVYLDPQDFGGAEADLHGAVDFTGVTDPAWDEVGVGMIVPSFQQSLALLSWGDLFSEERDVEVFGVTVGLPANLVIEGSAEDYYGNCWAGAAGSWGFAGPLKVSDVSSNTDSTADALDLLITNMPYMTWGYSVGATAVADTQVELDIAPSTAFASLVTLALPALTLGFHGDEEMLVFAADEHATDGWIVTGLSSGTTSAVLQTVPAGTVTDSVGSGVLVYAEVGGIGTSGQSSSSFGELGSDGSITLPDFQEPATLDSWEPSTSALGITTDTDASIVRVRFSDNRHQNHDLYVQGGAWTGSLPSAVSGFGKANATIEITAAQTEDGAFDEWLTAGAVEFGEMRVMTTARTLSE